MKLVLGYHTHTLVKKVIEKEIEKFGIEYTFNSSGQIEFPQEINSEIYDELRLNLSEYGIYVHENPKEQLIQRVKEVVDELIYQEDNYNYKTSKYISDKMDLSYGYISNLFSEVTLTTLEFYIILKRIERAKTMILSGEYNLTEVAYKLNYSSVAHLSGQFKKITGLTSSSFVKIMERRNFAISEN
jgi:AraC-like DNA-binding protein